MPLGAAKQQRVLGDCRNTRRHGLLELRHGLQRRASHRRPPRGRHAWRRRECDWQWRRRASPAQRLRSAARRPRAMKPAPTRPDPDRPSFLVRAAATRVSTMIISREVKSLRSLIVGTNGNDSSRSRRSAPDRWPSERALRSDRTARPLNGERGVIVARHPARSLVHRTRRPGRQPGRRR